MWRGNIFVILLPRKGLGVLVDTRLNISQKRALALCQQPHGAALGQSIANKSRVMILPFYFSLVRPHLEYYVQYWDSQYKTWTY